MSYLFTYIIKLLKSKTFDFNVIVAAVVTILSNFGVVVSVEVITAITTIGNIILRMITNKPISDK